MIILIIILCILVICDIAVHIHQHRKRRIHDMCNLANGILLRLALEAPGTFQHSLHVASLSAEACKRIRADIILVVAGAMYHDIGKLWNPMMYTENQQGSYNPHQSLTIEESVSIIKRHVTEGELLADREKLPEQIKAFISTHHGHGVIRYFYNTWCNNNPGKEPDMKLFTYPGKDPVTREQAVLMMADGIEAASRSLHEYSHQTISDLVEKMIDTMINSGRLKHARLTLRDLQRCKEAFIFSLETINHSRIAYPDLKKE